MNLLIKNKNTGETIHSLDISPHLEWSSENIYCYTNKGYKILSTPQLYLKIRGKNIDCNFIVKEVIKRGDIIIITGEKENIEYKLSFKGELL